MPSYRGWVSMITGGAGGLGRAIAARLVERGMRCMLVDIDAAALDGAVTALGPLAFGHAADLTDPRARDLLVERVRGEAGRLDVLINNAGIMSTQPFEQRSAESIQRELDVNLVAPLMLTRALLPELQRAGDGRVISIVSLGGVFPLPETTVYSATKFGLRGAMLSLGLEASRLGVKFGIVHPSATETPMLIREAIDGANKLQFMDPPQQPDEVARQVLRILDRPCLERYVRPRESWTARIAMLTPNVIGRVIPLFRRSAETGHRRYLRSLEQRGLIERQGEAWTISRR